MGNKNYELILKGNEAILLNEDSTTVNLEQAVSTTAMTLFAKMCDVKNSSSEEERKGLEREIFFQSKALNSLSNALSALK